MNKTKNSSKYSTVKIIVCVAFFAYVIYTLVMQQLSISEKKNQLMIVNQQISQEQEEKEELKSQLEIVNTPEYIERVAREELGYAAPDEIVFIDATSQK